MKHLIKKILREETSNIIIRQFNPNTDFELIYNNLSLVYHMVGMSNEEILEEIKPIDTNSSIVVEVGGNLAGFYFLRPKTIPEKVNPELYSELKNLSGVEGVALGVFPEYKNMGIGKRLIEYPKNMGYDYIWGYQYESLKNLKDWLKRRKYYGFDNDENAHITYQVF
jgi:hypothetical protein